MASAVDRDREGTEGALEAAARGALLVRCGGMACAGLLLSAGPARPGALVLVPGLLLLAADEDADLRDLDTLTLAERLPSVSVVVRRGRSESKPRAALTAGPAGATSVALRAQPEPKPAALAPHPDDLAEGPARLVAAWRWPELAAALPAVVSELKLSWDSNAAVSGSGTARGQDRARDLLSVFLLLQLQPSTGRGSSVGAALSAALGRAQAVPARGRGVCTACAPLGAPALLGAVSRGVVSGTAAGGLLTLTDARVTPGSEGAAVFALGRGDADALPFGVVLAPLTWWRGEAVGFTICVGLRRLLADALRHHGVLPLAGSDAGPDPAQRNDDELGVDCSVVLVRCAHMWGSGVVVDKRLVVTCAHVLLEAASEPVSVCWGAHAVRATVLWRSADGVPYDVAVLQLDSHPSVAALRPLPLDCTPPRVGEVVLAAGFPLFSERAEHNDGALTPLVSRGEVSGWWPSASSQILTTCCVQSGASGGPLLRPRPGGGLAVIGILVCNAQLGTGRDAVVYPHVNFALWVDALAAPIKAFLESGDERALEELQCNSHTVQRQWKLQPPRMSKL